MSRLLDERTIKGGNHIIGYLGPLSSSFTLAWLASHRNRLRSFVLGGKRLTILVAYDTRGPERVDRSDEEVDALKTIVYGPARDATTEETGDKQ